MKQTMLTSGSLYNEVVLDAACSGSGSKSGSKSGSGSKLPTNINFAVDGSSKQLHASCSQPLNLGDVIYKDENEGSLILVGFKAMSGRTESACGKPTPANCISGIINSSISRAPRYAHDIFIP